VQQFIRDDQALDLIGAFANLMQLGVAHVPFQELDHLAIEALRRFNHRNVPNAWKRDEPRTFDVFGKYMPFE